MSHTRGIKDRVLIRVIKITDSGRNYVKVKKNVSISAKSYTILYLISIIELIIKATRIFKNDEIERLSLRSEEITTTFFRNITIKLVIKFHSKLLYFFQIVIFFF